MFVHDVQKVEEQKVIVQREVNAIQFLDAFIETFNSFTVENSAVDPRSKPRPQALGLRRTASETSIFSITARVSQDEVDVWRDSN
jgi:hypothetical protein